MSNYTSRKLKIGVVCYPTFGGSGVLATELGSEMARQGHEIHFITSSMPVKLDLFTPNLFFHEVVFNTYPLFQYDPYEVALTSKIVDISKRYQLDLLHVHYALPHASAAYFAQQILKKEGIELPFVTTLHGTDITVVGKDAAFEPVIAFSINQSNAVTSVSQSLKDDTLGNFKVEKEIEVIPNFVCNSKYNDSTTACKKAAFAPNGEKIIMHISNFRKVKRIEDIISVFHLVQKKVRAKLLLIGEGPEKTGLERMVLELGLEKDVIFTGQIRETESALCAADLFLLASEKESFGLAALEAMAASVPVVSTNTGGLPEVNIHECTGLLYDVGDVNGMASGVVRLLSNESERQKFAHNAKEQALKFDIKLVLPQYLNLYHRVINN